MRTDTPAISYFFGLLLSCSLAAADDEAGIQLTSTLTLGYWSGSKNLDNAAARPMLTLQNRMVLERSNIKLLVDVLSTKRENTGGVNIRPRELYAQFNDGDWRVRLGRQIVNWGQADFLNPTQRFAAVDYRLRASQQGLEQSGVDGVRLQYSGGIFNFDAVASGFGQSSKIALGPIESLGLSARDGASSGVLVGLRVSNSDPVHELALSVSSGNNLLPAYRVVTPVLVDAFYPRVSVFGFDYVYNAGSYALKVETAYSKNLDAGVALGPVPLDQFHSVVGLERKLGDYTVAAAYSHKLVHGFKDANLANPLTRFNLTAADQLERAPKDFLFRITKLSPDLDAGYTAVLRKSLIDSGLAMYFLYQQKLSERATAVWGASLFQGGDLTYLGSFRKNNVFWAELRFGF
jgi:hypothetical protein